MNFLSLEFLMFVGIILLAYTSVRHFVLTNKHIDVDIHNDTPHLYREKEIVYVGYGLMLASYLSQLFYMSVGASVIAWVFVFGVIVLAITLISYIKAKYILIDMMDWREEDEAERLYMKLRGFAFLHSLSLVFLNLGIPIWVMVILKGL